MLAPAGRILAIAGQIGWDGASKLVVDDFVAQFGQALANLRRGAARGGRRAD